MEGGSQVDVSVSTAGVVSMARFLMTEWKEERSLPVVAPDGKKHHPTLEHEMSGGCYRAGASVRWIQ